jgi:hypothetical protein
MPEIFVAADDLAHLFDASAPAVLADARFLAALRGWEGGWRAFAVEIDGAGDLRVARDANAQRWKRLASLPAHVLAILLPAGPGGCDGFAGDAFAPAVLPPVARVETAEQALAELARVLAGEIGANARALVQARAALSEMRRENETLHAAMASALQLLGGQPVGAARLAFASGAAEDGPVHAAPEGRARGRQTLALPLKTLTSLRLHVAQARCCDRSWLKVRLQAADTGVAHGAWLIGGAALRPGWLTLDLRFVLGDLLQTAELAVETCLSGGDALALSLDPAEVEPAFAFRQDPEAPGPEAPGQEAPGQEAPDSKPPDSEPPDSEPPGRHALALRLFQGVFGRRTLWPSHWSGSEIGCCDAIDSLPRHLPPARWREAGIVEGEVEFVGLGTEPPHPVLALAPERPAAVRLRGLTFPGCDLVEIGLTLLGDPAQTVRFLAEIRPCGPEPAPPGPPPVWRLLGATTDVLRFVLRPPARDAAFDLQVSAELVEGAGPALVEWTSVAGLRLPETESRQLADAPAEAFASAEAEHLLWGPVCAPPPSVLFSGVAIDHVLRSPDGDYAHLDLTVYDLDAGDDYFPAIRFKLLNAAASPCLEFRQLPDWPGGFDIWPGAAADAHGPLFRLHPRQDALERLLAGGSARDGRMIRALSRALPQIVAAALNDPRLADEDGEPWRAAAALFAETQPGLPRA